MSDFYKSKKRPETCHLGLQTKWFCIFVSVFIFISGQFSLNAQDMIILRDGNMIEAKIMEIHTSEIRYKRFDNLDGPMIILPKASVLSIKYENGVLDILNASSAAEQEKDRTDNAGFIDRQFGIPAPLQMILNAFPAIPIAGNNLKFIFESENWTATVSGENFSAGTVDLEGTADGFILTLKQTHIWPGAVGRTAGRVANIIPGGGAVGGALNTAAGVAGAVGAVEASGPEIVLEYKAGPPVSLTFLRSAASASGSGTAQAPSENQMTETHPLTAANRFDLDGFNVFALSFHGTLIIPWSWGGGFTITIYEKYNSNNFFIPSYFLSLRGSANLFRKDVSLGVEDSHYYHIDISSGVLFKHLFPKNRILWNLGASLEFMFVWGHDEYLYYNDYGYVYLRNSYHYGITFLMGIGIQTGFSFRFNPYTSLDLNLFSKFPFGSVSANSVWPFTGGIDLGLTFWFPFKSRR